MSGTVFLVMGAPGAGTHTVVDRVRAELQGSKLFCFPGVVATRPCKFADAEVVPESEFQRRKVAGELPLFWSTPQAEVGLPPFIRIVEAGVNVVIEVPQQIISKVEKLFFYHKKQVIYVTAPEEMRQARLVASGAAPLPCMGKPLGANVSTVVNSGTVAEGAERVMAVVQQFGKQVIQFPASAVTVTVLRNTRTESREYLTENVIPGLTTALEQLVGVEPKPRDPYLWISQTLEANVSNAAAARSATANNSTPRLLEPNSFECRREEGAHILDEPAKLAGVANLRRSPVSDQVVGVCQPGSAAIRELVADLCGSYGKLIWLSVRESPVLYVNKQPHCIQSRGAQDSKEPEPPAALRAACVSSVKELAAIERQLATELAEAASQQGGSLQLFPANYTKDDANVEPEPVEVGFDGVQALQDVIDNLEAQGFDIELRRAMLPAVGAPEPEEVDEIVAAVRDAQKTGAAIVFSCATGVERTELGMVLATLMLQMAAGAEPRGYVDPIEGPRSPDLAEKAQYSAIIQLCQFFGSEGPVIKAVVDDLIDDHSSLIQFRRGIAVAAQCANDASPIDRSKAVCMAMGQLERYWHLIAFGAYLRAQNVDHFQQNFSTWLRGKRAIKRSLQKLCLF